MTMTGVAVDTSATVADHPTHHTDRICTLNRDTHETSIKVYVNLDGTGKVSSETKIQFLDHMIKSFGKHAMMDLDVAAKSNDGIIHHLVEDTGITIGQAINKALGERKGIIRFGSARVPMDESLAEATIDLVMRPFCHLSLLIYDDSSNIDNDNYSNNQKSDKIEDIQKEDLEHFFQSFLQNLNSCIHLCVKYGQNDHHKIEAATKALALSLRVASTMDARRSIDDVPSTKGSM